MLAQTGIRNAEQKKREFPYSIYQHLSKLAIEFRCYFLDFSVNNAFRIEISDAVILCACVFESDSSPYVF